MTSDYTGEAMIPEAARKAIREDYSPSPFFFRQEYEPGKVRWIAWTGSLPKLKAIVYRALGWFSEEVQILLKLQIAERVDPESGPWQRYHGSSSLKKLIAVIEENEDQVFLDGGSQLCVMCGGGGDYIALDEHGIFFLYTDGEGISEAFIESGFEDREQELLTENGHWHFRPGGNEKWQPFIEQLGLQAVESNQ